MLYITSIYCYQHIYYTLLGYQHYYYLLLVFICLSIVLLHDYEQRAISQFFLYVYITLAKHSIQLYILLTKYFILL